MDPHAQRVCDMLALAARPLAAQTVAEVRAGFRASRRVLAPPGDPVASVRDLVLGGVRVRLYQGVDALAGRCLLYFHGGGWVLGDLESHDAVCRRLANAAGCRVIAVDYRLAPEHPFPAAVDDAFAVFAAAVAEADDLGIDPAAIAVGGDSAGANLAAVLALHGCGIGGPKPRFQALLYPVVDLASERPSYARPADGAPLTAESMRWFGRHYAGPADRADWRLSPLRAASLSGLPPAFVLTVGHDPLCDEGVAYAEALDAAGVAVSHWHLPGQIHGFLTMGRVIPDAAMILDAAGCVLRHSWA